MTWVYIELVASNRMEVVMSLISTCSQLMDIPRAMVTDTAKQAGGAFASVLRKAVDAASESTASNASDALVDSSTKAGADTTFGASMRSAFDAIRDASGNITIASLSAAVHADLASVKERVTAILSEAGIAASPAYDLKPDGRGGISVGGGRADVAQIEALLNADATLQQTFTRMSANASLLQAAQDGAAFQDAYRENPMEAVNRFRYLFEDNSARTASLRMNGDAATLLG